ncbi:hypothetical protein [Spiroplasma endosymbiont of Polydrusus formosus]|uniref:hypothetical protein n=1 Tax=Spiroplasma endosymbiont of Polydrusus formosus TaxID=3139326 RepID=UPI0035B508DB
MENNLLRQASLIIGKKIEIINNNKEKCSMRKIGQIGSKLKIAKLTYYYQINKCGYSWY